MPNRGGFGTDLTEPTPAELVTGRVVLGPLTVGCIPLGELEPTGEVHQPFFELVLVAEGEAPNKAGVGFGLQELDSIDGDAADGGVENDLASVGVEGHLVRGFELVEEIVPRGGGGGFMVFDEKVTGRVGADTVEMAAEEVGLGSLWVGVT